MRLFDIADRAPPKPADPVTVNGVEISKAEITREIQNHPAGSANLARDAATRALVVRELLAQEAERLGIAPASEDGGPRETDEEARIRALLAREVAMPRPSEAECRRYYERKADRFRSPDLYEVSHILFSADPDDEEGYGLARQRAEDAIASLQSDRGGFEALAAAVSDCPSAGQGGNLGQIGPGQTVAEFEQALAEIPPGSVSSRPVESRYGVHVIRVARKIAGQTLPFDAVHGKIADYLADCVFHRAVHQYVAILAGRAEINGIAFERAASPLVQ